MTERPKRRIRGRLGHFLPLSGAHSFFPKNFLKTDLFLVRGGLVVFSLCASRGLPVGATKEWQRARGTACSPMYSVTEKLLPAPAASWGTARGLSFWYVAARRSSQCEEQGASRPWQPPRTLPKGGLQPRAQVCRTRCVLEQHRISP